MQATGAFLSGGLVFCVLAAPLAADETLDRHAIAFFEKRIRPVLVERCYECHSESAKHVRGELRLDTPEALERGGRSGPVLVRGEPRKSLLVAALEHHGELKMPPTGKLPDHVIADFVKWVEIGAPDPRDGERNNTTSRLDLDTVWSSWAFRPLRNTHDSIDELVAARREEKGLQAAPPADRYTLLRRLSFDLTGLPPEAEVVREFARDRSPDAYERVVDRLLGSPRFGERWGRHWLDLTQYADSLDAERIFPNRGAWRYRDYVIGAFNEDKPYDRFVVEQLAGDLLPAESDEEHAEQIVATQFITLGPMNLVNQFKAQLRMDIVDNQVDKISRVFLGLTMGCARCHDHKFDPIAQHDYYALAGIFQNVQVLNGFRGVSGVFSDWLRRPIPELPHERLEREQYTRRHRRHAEDLEARLREKRAEVTRHEQRKEQTGAAGDEAEAANTAEQLKKEISKLETELRDHVKANPPRPPLVLAALEPPQPTNARITIRGNALQLGDEVTRGVPRVLRSIGAVPPSSSGRLEFARSLVEAENPIVARVFVNRVWHHLFGTGIVRTVDNFGALAEPPSHPELLDALAARFVAGGWRIKALIRELVVSRTYRLSSVYDSAAHAVDPDNRLLWRHSPRRLDAEAIRDTLLKVGGTMSTLGGGPTLPPAEWNTQEVAQFDQINQTRGGRPDILHGRSIFLPVSRAATRFAAGEVLRQFDFPSPNDIVGARRASIVPTQSLYLLNSPFVQARARDLASRLLANASWTDRERLETLYLAVFGRPARAAEVRDGLEFLSSARVATQAEEHDQKESDDDPRLTAIERLCHAVLISTEFLLHD